MGLVVDLGPHQAVANPLKIPLSGFPAKFVTRAYHLYAIPRGVNRWAVALAYLTDALVCPVGGVARTLDTERRRILHQRRHSTAKNWLRRVTAS